MNGLAVTEENLKNQQGVVGNEVKVNVLNRPYGGFPWLDMPQYANTNWYNAHNFYGDLKDIEAATLAEVQSFLQDLLCAEQRGAGDRRRFRSSGREELVEKYFGGIKASELASTAGSHRAEAGKRKDASQSRMRCAKRPATSHRLPHAGTQHAGILRNGTDRSDPHRRR